MSCGGYTFFSFVEAILIAQGKSGKGYEVDCRGNNGVAMMAVQCMREYSALPDPRTLSVPEIKYFYGYLAAELLGGQ